MRKFFRFATMALVAIAITACDKDDKKTIAPDNGGDEDYKEITVSCSIDLMAGIETVGYSMGEMSMPGDKILEFFDMTAKDKSPLHDILHPPGIPQIPVRIQAQRPVILAKEKIDVHPIILRRPIRKN